MGTFNLRYDLDQPEALAGMVADSRLTHTLSVVATGAIAPGQAVGYDGAALDTDAPMIGVARLETSLEQTDSGVVAYAVGDSVPVVSFGPVWGSVSAAVTAGAPAYVTLATGVFVGTAGAGTTTAAVGYFETATAGAGLAKIFVQRGI